MESLEILSVLAGKFGEGLEAVTEGPESHLKLPAREVASVCTFLKEDPTLDCDLLTCISAVDLKGLKGETTDDFEVVYHLESTRKLHTVCLRLRVPRESPKVPSVSAIWETANWHEREAYDLMGIEFEGHPNLVRILCADDWVGHPLRKDYEYPKEYHGVHCEFEGNQDGTWGGPPGK
jgi:NADH-quinone oxidoreductase subunit C